MEINQDYISIHTGTLSINLLKDRCRNTWTESPCVLNLQQVWGCFVLHSFLIPAHVTLSLLLGTLNICSRHLPQGLCTGYTSSQAHTSLDGGSHPVFLEVSFQMPLIILSCLDILYKIRLPLDPLIHSCLFFLNSNCHHLACHMIISLPPCMFLHYFFLIRY